MCLRHSGQPLSIAATASAQLSQNREWPHGTRVLSSLTSEVTWKDSVCPPRHVLIARRNCSLLYDPLSYRSMHALMRTSFWILHFFFRRRMLIPFLSRAASVILSAFRQRLQKDTLAALRYHCCSWEVQFIRCYLVTGLLRIPAVI